MTENAFKARHIHLILNRLFPNPPVPLHHRDPFTLLVAVVLSANSTDAAVNRITPMLFERADNPYDMARLSVEEVREIIKPCGLSPAKSKALVGLSQIILEKHGGQVPQTFEELEALPGVGHKTASVVMSQAFNTPAFPVDTHIHRLARRWGLSDGRSVERTERDLKAAFPEESWNLLHIQIIYFGRTWCPAKKHDPAKCPVCMLYGTEPGHTSLETVVRQLDQQLQTLRPEYYACLNPGLSMAEIQQLETEYQLRLPDEVKRLYHWKNGQQADCSDAFINNSMFMPLQTALETAKELTEMIGVEFESENWWRPGWLPIFENGGGDYLCYDKEAGQLISFRHDEARRNWVAPGLRVLLLQLQIFYENKPPAGYDGLFNVQNPDGYPIQL